MSSRLSRIPDPIEWHDGMLLTPQHFEDLTQRLEGLIEHATATAVPFNWGVLTLEFDETELLEGLLTVSQMEAILPDGMAIWQDTRSTTPLQLDLTALEAAFKTGIFTVYAALPAASEDAARMWRYRQVEISADQTVDANSELPIPRLQPRIHLIASHTHPGSRYSCVPLAQLQFRNGAYTRIDGYLAPARQMLTDSPLCRGLVATLRRVREVAIILQQQWRSLSAQERESLDVSRRNAVQQLVAVLPYNEAMVEAGECHPFQIYLGFCALAGHVASISSDPIPPAFPRYNHADMVASFRYVTDYIQKILAENTSEDFIGVPFSYGDETYYLMFEPSWKGRKLVLAMQTGELPRHEVAAWGEQALIGSSILQDSMRDRRVLGARRQYTEREPGLFSGPGTVLFQLHNDDEFIQGGELLEVVSGPSGRGIGKPAEMTLYIMQA